MKSITILIVLFAVSFLGGCQTSKVTTVKPSKVQVTGPIEITSYKIEHTEKSACYIAGKFIDEYSEPMAFLTVHLDSTLVRTNSDIDGNFKLDSLNSGKYMLYINQMGSANCSIEVELQPGDQLEIEAGIARYGGVIDLKPIIYLYPEINTDVSIQLTYDGELTTSYPRYPDNGWNVNAQPDGTLTDENGKEYYALYWEGTPRETLKIDEGFVVSKEETITFLEEKLPLLGLNAKEANEFIIFWLPILEKNEFNLIHFSGEDYLKKAQLNISPTPDTEIRISMVFQGLDEEIDFPIQDLSPLMKTRKGFTVVEWGGQELPKSYKLAMK